MLCQIHYLTKNFSSLRSKTVKLEKSTRKIASEWTLLCKAIASSSQIGRLGQGVAGSSGKLVGRQHIKLHVMHENMSSKGSVFHISLERLFQIIYVEGKENIVFIFKLEALCKEIIST